MSEFIDWIAFFQLEREDADRRAQDIQERQDTQRALRALSGRSF